MAAAVGRCSRSHDKAAVSHMGVILCQFLRRNENNARFIIGEIVGHGLDIPANPILVGPRFRDHVTVAAVFVLRGKLRFFASPDLFDGFLDGDGVLSGIDDSRNPPDGVGVPLADARTPKRVTFARRKNRFFDHPQYGKQSRVPSGGYDGRFTRSDGRPIDCLEIIRNLGVGVVTVHGVEKGRHHGALIGKVSCRSAAKDGDIDLVKVF